MEKLKYAMNRLLNPFIAVKNIVSVSSPVFLVPANASPLSFRRTRWYFGFMHLIPFFWCQISEVFISCI